jgi:SAM-dependent methyltransferase
VDAAGWDARYSGSDLVWGLEPNRFVATELEGLKPGRALDVACGEGRNTVWLARQGWHATGADFSAAGVARAVQLAAAGGVSDATEFVVADVVAGPLPAGPFDAVVMAYLQLPTSERRRAVRQAAGALSQGGTLLIVGHDTRNLTDGVGGPQDPEVLFSPQDIVDDLEGLSGLVIEKAESVARPVDTPDGPKVAIDALVRLHRADELGHVS